MVRRKLSWESVLGEGLILLALRVHTEGCKECRKKYLEILKHVSESIEKDAKSLHANKEETLSKT